MSETEIILAATSKLNYQQILFCEGINEGLNQTEAYLKAFPNSSKESANANGARLIASDKVKEYIYSLKAIMKPDTPITRELIAKVRKDIMLNPKAKHTDQLTAARDASKSQGLDEAEEQIHSFKVVWGE